MAHRNFARGTPPPSHSYEWVGSAKPPGPPQRKEEGTPVIVATLRETIVMTKKPRVFLPLLAGGVVGFIAGHYVARY